MARRRSAASQADLAVPAARKPDAQRRINRIGLNRFAVVKWLASSQIAPGIWCQVCQPPVANEFSDVPQYAACSQLQARFARFTDRVGLGMNSRALNQK